MDSVMQVTVLYCCIFIGILVIYRIRKEKIISPYFMFTFYWLFVFLCFLYCNIKFELFSVTMTTIHLYGIGIIAFNISNFHIIKSVPFVSTKKDENDIDRKRVFFLFAFGICLSLIFFVRCIKLMRQGYSTANIRNLFINNPTPWGPVRNSLETILYNVVVTPLKYVAISLLPMELFNGKRNKWILAMLITFLIVCDPAGGRILYLNVAISLIVYFLFWSKDAVCFKRKSIKRKRKLIIVVTILMICLMYMMSIFRGIDASRLINQFLLYYGGSINFFDNKLINLSDNFEYTYGMTFGASFFRIIFKFYEIFGISVPSRWNELEEYISTFQKFIEIGESTKFNAFTGVFYYFYLDGGFISVFLESFLWGIICRYIYKKFILTKKKYYVSMYLILVVGITTSMSRWPFYQWQYTFAFLYIRLLQKDGIYKMKYRLKNVRKKG